MCQTIPHAYGHSERRGQSQSQKITSEGALHKDERSNKKNHFEVVYLLRLRLFRNSTASPPTRLWGRRLAADGWADAGGIWFKRWLCICKRRI